MWPTASSSCSNVFPAIMDCWTSIHTSFHKLFLLVCFITAIGKVIYIFLKNLFHSNKTTYQSNLVYRAREMVQQLRTLVALPEHLGLVPESKWRLTTVCNSHTVFWPPYALYPCGTYAYMQAHTLIKLKKTVMLTKESNSTVCLFVCLTRFHYVAWPETHYIDQDGF